MVLQVGAGIFTGSQPSVGHGPARPAPSLQAACPGARENFYYIPFLTRWQAEIAGPEPVRCAHSRKYAIPPRSPDLNIYPSTGHII